MLIILTFRVNMERDFTKKTGKILYYTRRCMAMEVYLPSARCADLKCVLTFDLPNILHVLHVLLPSRAASPKWAPVGSNCPSSIPNWAPVGPNWGPIGAHLGPTGAQLGPIWNAAWVGPYLAQLGILLGTLFPNI